jgi:hypothetical protein
LASWVPSSHQSQAESKQVLRPRPEDGFEDRPRDPAFTIDTYYQQVLCGMQTEAARVFEQLIAPVAGSGIGRLKDRQAEDPCDAGVFWW